MSKLVFFLIFTFLTELLALRLCAALFENRRQRRKFIVIYIIIAVAMLAIEGIMYLSIGKSKQPDYIQFRTYFNITAVIVLNLAPKLILSVFSMGYHISLFIGYIMKLFVRPDIGRKYPRKIKRAYILTGLVLSALLFVNIAYGILWGGEGITVNRMEIVSTRLPEAFNGFKIVQISDLHLGSFKDTKAVEEGLDAIARENPDMVLFTGDMVNNVAGEAKPFVSYFKKLNPPSGMYSILGNHDMGDYRRWYKEGDKETNLNELQRLQKEMGFELLRNSHRYIKKGNDSIAVAGVDNWGVPPFKQYGDLKKAMKGVDTNDFCILLSHDPSHWMHEVVDNVPVALTLSGHTHGFQFVFNLGNYRFSPVQWKYEQWGGLYCHNTQYLYVNTGFGFIGFPGRIGVKPEITVFTLRCPDL